MPVRTLLYTKVVRYTQYNISNNNIFRVDLQQEVLDMEKNGTNSSTYDMTVTEKDNVFTMYGVYTILRCVGGVIAFYALMKFCQRASVFLHKSMLDGLMGAKMSFFDSHYIGNILNRFSYDLNNIDESIPFVFPSLASVSSIKFQFITNMQF